VTPAPPRGVLHLVIVPNPPSLAGAPSAAGQRAARLAARRALAGLPGAADACIERLHAPGGAPVARVDGATGLVRVSVTHSAGLAGACAWIAAPGYAAGVDLERVRPTKLAENTVAFSARELALLAAAPEGAETAALAAWTVKEAVWKALQPAQPPAPALIELDGLDLAAGHAMAGAPGGVRVHARVRRIAGPDGPYWLAVAQLASARSVRARGVRR
jgi:hypothetical protein